MTCCRNQAGLSPVRAGRWSGPVGSQGQRAVGSWSGPAGGGWVGQTGQGGQWAVRAGGLWVCRAGSGRAVGPTLVVVPHTDLPQAAQAVRGGNLEDVQAVALEGSIPIQVSVAAAAICPIQHDAHVSRGPGSTGGQGCNSGFLSTDADPGHVCLLISLQQARPDLRPSNCSTNGPGSGGALTASDHMEQKHGRQPAVCYASKRPMSWW